jgi:tetratricopeptide (TPR) repeat protein
MRLQITKIILFVLIAFGTTTRLTAQGKTFIREYTYNASELDSKISSRAIAINELRLTLLNELGVYVESESILKTSEVGGKFSQHFIENIITLSAGVTKLEVLDESWDGKTFWMKASITVDKKDLEESLRELIADKKRTKDLEDIRHNLSNATKEIERLKKELIETKSPSRIDGISREYNNEVRQLKSGDFFLSGLECFTRKDYYQAISNYTKAIELTPKFAAAHLHMGLSKNYLGDMTGALADLTMSIELNPEEGFGYYSRGVTKAMTENYRGAIADLDRAIDTDEQWISAYYYRGLSKRYLEDYNGAIRDQTRTIQLDPKFTLAYIDLGLVKTILGDYRDAAADLSKAIEIDPNSGDAFYLRGLARSLGRLSGSCSDLRKSLDLGNRKAFDTMMKLCN